MRTESQQGITSEILSGIKWTYLGTAFRVGSQLLINIVLARILGPEPYGVMAAVWLVLGLCGIVAEAGTGSVLVQRSVIHRDDIRAAFSVQVVVGTVLSVAVASAATPLSVLFQAPQLSLLLRVLAPSIVIQSVTQTAASLLRREMDFRHIQISQVVSYAVAFMGLGVPAALLGADVWSLVIAHFAQVVTYAVMVYGRTRHPIGFVFTSDWDMYKFGYRVTATNLINWLIENMDNAFVGRVFGVVSLGLYSRAYNLVRMPVNNLVSVIQGVLFPAYSRIQEHNQKLSRAYLASLSIISLLGVPLFGNIAIASHTVVTAMYGEEWSMIGGAMVPLALAMPFHALLVVNGPVVWAKGRVELELRAQFLVLFLLGGALLLTAGTSIEQLSWGVMVVYVVRAFLLTRAASKTVGVTWLSVARAIFGGFALWLVTGPAVQLMDHLLVTHGVPALLRLLADVMAGIAVLVVLWLPGRSILLTPDLLWLLTVLEGKIPARFRRVYRILCLKA